MDNSVFEKLVLQNEQTLYRVSMSMLKNEADAQDAVHDAILKAFEKIDTLKKEEAFSAWLTRILIRCCYKQLKRNKHYDVFGENLPEASSRDNPYVDLEIGEAINNLSPKIRVVIILYYVENYSIKEITRILNIPEGTVKSRLKSGRQQLKSELQN